MQAVINGILVTGTPEEIAKYNQIVNGKIETRTTPAQTTHINIKTDPYSISREVVDAINNKNRKSEHVNLFWL